MKIHSIDLHKFTTHTERSFHLPPGVSVIVGGNGKGKSSIVEAVAFAAFGKTLRGAAPGDADAEIGGYGLNIRRSKKGNKQSLVATVNVPITGDTVTKIQDQIDASLMSFDVWRRTCVFSSADAAHFSSSTDAERKRFLESALGVVKFDELLAAAKNELVAAERAFSDASARLTAIQQEISNQTTLIAGLTAQLNNITPTPSVDLVAMARKISDLEVTQQIYLTDVARLREAMSAASHHGVGLQKQLALIKLPDVECHACKRAFTDDKTRSYVRAKAEEERAALTAEINAARAEYVKLQDALSELQTHDRSKELADAVREYATLQNATGSDAIRSSLLDALNKAQSELAALSDAMARVEDELKQADSAVALATQVATTFSLRGARVLYMQGALLQLETYANTYLAQLGDIRITIRGQTEKKTGGMSDTISLACEGPCGKSYDELSGGQRRRVDIALLLALSEMSPASRGATLFFDEVFDALDTPGQEAAARLLSALANQQRIVVITHNKDLLQFLQPACVIDLGD